jgi:hypothetical protein
MRWAVGWNDLLGSPQTLVSFMTPSVSQPFYVERESGVESTSSGAVLGASAHPVSQCTRCDGRALT